MRKKRNTLYFKGSNGELLSKSQKGVYRLNSTTSVLKVISEEVFNSMNPKPIKHQLYCKEMNSYFKYRNDKWTYQGVKYRKLPNFYKDIIFNKDFTDKFHNSLVYHWGKVYQLELISEFPLVILKDMNGVIVRRTFIYNIAPISVE